MRTTLLQQHHAALRISTLCARSQTSRKGYVKCSPLFSRPSRIHVAFASNTSTKRDVLKRNVRTEVGATGLLNEIALDPQYDIEGIVPDLSTTRPTPLHVPDPPHDLAYPSSRSLNPTNWSFKYLFALGKGYLTLYKTGFKNVWYNMKTMRQIQKRIGSRKAEDLQNGAAYIENSRITYNELELVLRTKRDLKKLLPFGLILAICGEFTPLVVLAFGSAVVPGTCVIPKQQAQDMEKALKRYNTWNSEIIALLQQSNSSFSGPLEQQTQEQDLNLEIMGRQKFRPSALYRTTDHLTRISSLEAYRLGWLPLAVAQNPQAWYFAPLLRWADRKHKRSYGEVYAAAVAVQREGGWSKRSSLDMWEWGTKYGLYQLIKYGRDAHARGQNPISDDLKTTLLPVFEQETRHLIDSEAKQMRLSSDSQHILDIDSPDATLERDELEARAKEKSE